MLIHSVPLTKLFDHLLSPEITALNFSVTLLKLVTTWVQIHIICPVLLSKPISKGLSLKLLFLILVREGQLDELFYEEWALEDCVGFVYKVSVEGGELLLDGLQPLEMLRLDFLILYQDWLHLLSKYLTLPALPTLPLSSIFLLT